MFRRPRAKTLQMHAGLHAQVTAMMAAPFAAVSLEGFAGKLADLRKQVKAVRDRIYYGDLLPPVGSQQLSYARFMQLLTMKQVKRVTLMADGQIALVEVRGVGRDHC